MADRINFLQKVNVSVQVDDVLYYSYVTPGGQASPIEIGPITAVGNKFVEVASNTAPVFNIDQTFFMFKKPVHNNESIKGYFAEARLSTSSTKKIELFAIGSEVTVSSK